LNVIKKFISRCLQVLGIERELWSRDFTILTLGSYVSIGGSTAITFILGVLILDLSRNNLLYSLTAVISNLAGIAVPLVAATFMEHMSRRRIIFSLDFLNAAILVFMAFLYRIGVMSTAVVFAYCLVFGILNSVYKVAFDSYLPQLIPARLYTKAYSVSSMISTMAEVYTLVGTVCYELMDVSLVFIICAGLYFVAACFETHMRSDARPAVFQQESAFQRYRADIQNSLSFMKKNRAVLVFSLSAFFETFAIGAFYTVTVPFFKYEYAFAHWDGNFVYIFAMAFMSTGAFWGGVINYRLKISARSRYILYVTSTFLELTTLTFFTYFSMPVTVGMLFIGGIANTICFSLRTACLYAAVPHEIYAKFAGFLQTLFCLGNVLGIFIGGLLSSYLSVSTTLIIANSIALAFFLVMLPLLGKRLMKLFDYQNAPPKDFNPGS